MNRRLIASAPVLRARPTSAGARTTEATAC